MQTEVDGNVVVNAYLLLSKSDLNDFLFGMILYFKGLGEMVVFSIKTIFQRNYCILQRNLFHCGDAAEYK